MSVHSLEPSLTDAQIMHAVLSLALQLCCKSPQKPIVFGTDNTVESLYLQMKLLYDAGDQPGELVHIDRVDESHCFFYAV